MSSHTLSQTADCTVDTYTSPLMSGNCNSSSDVPHETQCMFTCDSGYTLVGSSDITCTDGSLDDTLPTCKGKIWNCNVIRLFMQGIFSSSVSGMTK